MKNAAQPTLKSFTTLALMILLGLAAKASGISVKGDFNGDGIADLAIGIPGKNLVRGFGKSQVLLPDAGAVQIIYGTAATGLAASGANIPSSQLIHASLTPLLNGAQANDLFGSALAVGDFNNDGFADLAVGLPGRFVSGFAGAVMIFFGSSTGLSSTPSQTFLPSNFYPIPNVTGTEGAFSLASGDFNGDGIADLVVASLFCNGCSPNIPQTAEITTLLGSASGLTTTGTTGFEFTPLFVASGVITPRAVLTAGDFNNDGISDLVVGMPLDTVNGLLAAGGVHIFFGLRNFGPTVNGQLVFFERTPGLGNEFGSSLAVGDFNGDGFLDLAAGAPGAQNNAGEVEIIRGSATGLTGVTQQVTRSTLGEGASTAGDNFGLALAAGDFNHDGFTDLAIGNPGESLSGLAHFGAVYVSYGSITFLSSSVHAPQRFVRIGGSAAGDQFGSSLAAANFGLSANADLAIGAPFALADNLAGAGTVEVLYGSTSGLTTTGVQLWTENSADLDNTSAANDHFGQAIH